jgi:large subunit ribosomal protein L15
MTIQLNEIKDNLGARKKRMRVGRGIGSGKGKTCGRGGKGQTARSGVSINGFEGGQTPIYRRLPKRGFNNIHRIPLFEMSMDKLTQLVEKYDIKKDVTITRDFLVNLGEMKAWQKGITLFGNATKQFSNKVSLEVVRASASAKAAVEKAGGEIKFG